ncbi:hypothetical protein [Paenibacillus sp. NPDC058071]|uniref:hypothetical protein n=1 Tax=Paenibacillus sp. NPDC058071 TaxID=3346326 RepID=UPI0036D894A2
MRNKILKWVLLLCVVSLVLNGLLYWGTGNREVLINTYGAAGIGILSAIWLLFVRKEKQKVGRIFADTNEKRQRQLWTIK